jgi:hypothetical protein
VIVRDAPNWTDAWSVDECNAAIGEAIDWLDDHPEYADPAEVRADA